jgi:ABC-type multidrug transport system ATPase subunit
MESILEIKNINFYYKKSKPVLNDITFLFTTGLWVLLGPNGAGKTTLIKVLSTILKQNSGCMKYNKNKVDSYKDVKKYRKYMGYMPQKFVYFNNYSAIETICYSAYLKGIKNSNIKQKSMVALNLVDMTDKKNEKMKNLSGGMVQRIGLACAIVGDSKILLLDEPTVGLDPEQRIDFRNILIELSKNKIIILSTHLIEEIELLKSNVIIEKNGKFIWHGVYSDMETTIKTNVGKNMSNIEKNYLSFIE